MRWTKTCSRCGLVREFSGPVCMTACPGCKDLYRNGNPYRADVVLEKLPDEDKARLAKARVSIEKARAKPAKAKSAV